MLVFEEERVPKDFTEKLSTLRRSTLKVWYFDERKLPGPKIVAF